MAYRDNWLRHLSAPFTGEGLSNDLAADFSREDLWNPAIIVRWRWVKLVFAYWASVLVQFAAAAVLAGIIIELVKGVPWFSWVIFVGGGTVLMLLFATVVATTVYIGIQRRARRGSHGA